jgi:AcrR family transcriptional regulator
MRTDAVKNRQRILDAAEEVFAAQGVGVPIDVVAERAGLGVGTLYRHFPNKEALFEAIVTDRISELLATAHEFEVAEDPGQAIFAFLSEFAGQASAKRDLFEALSSAGIDLKERCGDLFDELMKSVTTLLDRAVEAGAVRSDVAANEVVGLIVGTCHAAGESGLDDSALHRMVAVVMDGLRPASRAT